MSHKFYLKLYTACSIEQVHENSMFRFMLPDIEMILNQNYVQNNFV